MVQTVTGPIASSEMGKTLIHEHFIVGLPGYLGDLTVGSNDREQTIEIGVRAAKKMMAHGVRTVVDPTPNDYGRDVQLLRDISERTGLQIICATGYHSEEKGATQYFKKRKKAGHNILDEIYEMMMQEITQGIGRTGVRAGFIKVASSKNAITGYEESFFRAAGRASRDAGVPILTHTENGTMGPEQADLLISEGADPTRILIGHMCGNQELDYHLDTLSRGVSIAFDRFGFPNTDDEMRIQNLLKFMDLGYTDRLLMSHDAVITTFGRENNWTPAQLEQRKNWHPAYLFETIIPSLLARGVHAEILDTIFMANPARLFGV